MPKAEAKILLVEDNPADIELTLHALRTEKICNHIQVARDGEEALDYIFRRAACQDRPPECDPTLILLDLKLPKVDGLQVLRVLKANADTRLIPVVILTSSTEERDLVESYRLGVNSYIQKPVDFVQFRETVKQLGLYWLVVNHAAPAHSVSAAHV